MDKDDKNLRPKVTKVEEYTNNDLTRTIKITAGRINFYEWGMTLPEPELSEFRRITNDHENFVQAAKEAGDVIITKDGEDFTLVWKSYDIHCKWIATVPPEDHRQYLDYWRRYREYI